MPSQYQALNDASRLAHAALAGPERHTDHNYTNETEVTFTYESAWGSVNTETFTLGDFFGDVTRMSLKDIEDNVALEHGDWLLEQVQDNASWEIGR